MIISRIEPIMKNIINTIAFVLCTTTTFAATFTPIDVSQFAVSPNTATTLRWKGTEKVTYTVYDVYGNATDIKGIAEISDGVVSLTVSLPSGYWEIGFDQIGQRFGVVSLSKSEEKNDPFFAIDGALSWLVHGDELREGMIKLVKNAGIGMVRERLRYSSIAPEEGKFDWDTKDNYDLLRETYKKHGVEILEIFHDAPKWMGRVEVYPENLVQFADVADKVAEKWEHTWGGIEIWNEPDIFFGGNLPADQYVPLIKAYAYRANKRGAKTPVVGGVLAAPNEPWINNAISNNMLDLIDVFSFHTYDRAPNMENVVKTYRNIVAGQKQHENMPLWLTECGRPWKKGPGRPPVEQDLESVTDIVMKGVESKCCGVAKYFPFVLPYYEENDNNFGMLDKQGTPLRSFGGYAQMIHALAHAEYVGDLKSETIKTETGPEIFRARVFQKPNSGLYIVVLYTGKTEPTKFAVPFNVQKTQTVTGETCDPTEIRSGLIYLYAETITDEMLEKNTEANRLLAFARKPYTQVYRDGCLSPIIPVYMYDAEKMTPHSHGYKLNSGFDKSAMSFRLHNLSGESVQVCMTPDTLDLKPFEVNEYKSKHILENVESEKLYNFDFFTETANRVQLRFFGSPTMEGQRKLHPNAARVPLDSNNWRANISGNGKLQIENVDGGVKFTATFTDGDRWCYPKINVTENVKLNDKGGIFAKIRCSGDKTVPRLFLFEKPSEAGYLSDDSYLGTPGDDWRIISIPFFAFSYNGSTPPDTNFKLDYELVKEISFGFNTNSDNASLEIAELWVY